MNDEAQLELDPEAEEAIRQEVGETVTGLSLASVADDLGTGIEASRRSVFYSIIIFLQMSSEGESRECGTKASASKRWRT
jgi:hypothetical protein